MRSATIAAAAIAMASSVSAQATPGFAVFANPSQDEVVPAGKPYTLEWAAGTEYSGAAVLSLIGGETQNTQMAIGNITTFPDVAVNKYTWNVDCSLGKAKVYGLTITLVEKPEVFQWSNRFHIDNSGCGDSAEDAASTSASSSAAVYPTMSESQSVYPTMTPPTTSQTSSQSATVTKSETAAPTETGSFTTKPTASASHTSTTTGSTPIPTAAAPRVAAGSFVLAGAAAAAVLAL